jgi:hypothetical protein
MINGYLHLGTRGSGKTFQCVEWLYDHPKSILIVADERRRKQIISHFNLTKEQAEQVVTPLSYRSAVLGKHTRPEVVIDQLHDVLQVLLGAPVVLATEDEGS